MDQITLDNTLELHSKYLRGEPGGVQADLRRYPLGYRFAGANYVYEVIGWGDTIYGVTLHVVRASDGTVAKMSGDVIGAMSRVYDQTELSKPKLT